MAILLKPTPPSLGFLQLHHFSTGLSLKAAASTGLVFTLLAPTFGDALHSSAIRANTTVSSGTPD